MTRMGCPTYCISVFYRSLTSIFLILIVNCPAFTIGGLKGIFVYTESIVEADLIQGKVTDVNGAPLTGVNILVKGSNKAAASGGMDTWRKLNAGQFKRTHKLYSVSGELLSSREEIFYFQRSREGIKLMVNAKRSGKNPVIIGKDDQGFWAVENDAFIDNPRSKAKDLGMMCDSEFCTPDCDMQMAYFRFSMPFKLKDPGVIPQNAGTSELLGETCKVLKIGYEPKVGKDEWVFFVNEKDLIVKMEFHHTTDKGKHLPEEFFWSDHKNVNGLMISHKWTRYWNNGKVLEEYTFSDFDFESPLPDYFYQRPNSAEGLLTFND